MDFYQNFSYIDKIYLNNASVSIMPLTSIKAMKNFLFSYNEMGPDSLSSESFIVENLIQTRKIISKLIKCTPDKIVLTQSTTDGINVVSNGLSLPSNSNIVIRGMNHEHHANFYPWIRLRKETKIRNLKVDKNGFFDITELRDNVDKNTKLVVLSHALYNTGSIMPVDEIGELLEKTNTPYFIDAAQTVGCIGTFDVNQCKCDFMSFNGSKWLCGPMGTGIFYCNNSDLLEPTYIGGESVMLFKNKLVYKDMPHKFQTAFRNYVGIAGLNESVSYIMKIGLEKIRSRVIYLANLFRSELLKINGTKIYGPDDQEKRTSIVSFNINSYDPKTITSRLEKQKIILAVREIFNKKIIRASPHFFNTENEIMGVIHEIKKIIN